MSAAVVNIAEIRTAAQPARLRLTRRGRAVFGTLGTLAAVLVFAFVAMFGASQAEASAVASGAEFGYVIVQPGDSLWTVASSIAPNADPRDTISELVRLNQLEDADVFAGEALAVPLRYSDAPGVVPASELQ